MSFQSIRHVELALKRLSFAQSSTAPSALMDAALQCKIAIDDVVADQALWNALNYLGNNPAGDPSPCIGFDKLAEMLSERLIDVMVRIRYEPPPDPNDLVGNPRQYFCEMQEETPRLHRSELVNACKVGLYELRDHLDDITNLEREAAAPTTAAVLNRTKPALVGLSVVASIVSQENDDNLVIRLNLVDASLKSVYKWLSCQYLRGTPPGELTH